MKQSVRHPDVLCQTDTNNRRGILETTEEVFSHGGGKACGKAQTATKRPLCQRKTEGGLENGLANLWRGKKITNNEWVVFVRSSAKA